MTREERIALHKKQERTQIKRGVPAINDLDEGVPSIRITSDGVVQYVKVSGVMYKTILERV